MLFWKGFFGVLFGLINVFVIDGDLVRSNGAFQGYNHLVWSIVFISAIGGLLIAAVIAYVNKILILLLI